MAVFFFITINWKMSNKRIRLGRPSSKNWDHFKEGPKRNTTHKTAICNYCAKDVLGVSEQMINHLCECENADVNVQEAFQEVKKNNKNIKEANKKKNSNNL